MMKTTIATSAAALLMLSGAAVAEPTVMSDEQMDLVVAGKAMPMTGDTLVLNRGGQTVWTLRGASGFNNGGKGRTDVTAPNLIKGPITNEVFSLSLVP